LKDYQVLNAWLSVLKKCSFDMKQKPEIFLEYHCEAPVDLIVKYFEYDYIWICELKSKHIDEFKNNNQINRLLNSFSEEKLIQCGILNAKAPQDFMVLFVLGDDTVLHKVNDTIDNICRTKKNKYEILGIKKVKSAVQIVMYGESLRPPEISNKIRTIKARYKAFFSVLLDESTIRGKNSKVKLILINSLLEVVSTHNNSDKFNWDDISNVLKNNWNFFELSKQLDRDLRNLFKKIMKPFVDKELLRYDSNNKNWIVTDKNKFFNIIHDKSAFIKKIVAKDNKQLSLPFEGKIS